MGAHMGDPAPVSTCQMHGRTGYDLGDPSIGAAARTIGDVVARWWWVLLPVMGNTAGHVFAGPG